MMSGLPVIATPVGCVPDLITDRVSGMVVPGTPESIRDAAILLEKYPAWAGGLASEARKIADEVGHARQMAQVRGPDPPALAREIRLAVLDRSGHPATLKIAEQVADLRSVSLSSSPSGISETSDGLISSTWSRGDDGLLAVAVDQGQRLGRLVDDQAGQDAAVAEGDGLRLVFLADQRRWGRPGWSAGSRGCRRSAPVRSGPIASPSSKSLWQTAQFSLKTACPRAALPLSPSGRRPRTSAIRRIFSGEPGPRDLAPDRLQPAGQRRVVRAGRSGAPASAAGPSAGICLRAIASSSGRGPRRAACRAGRGPASRTAGVADRVASRAAARRPSGCAIAPQGVDRGELDGLAGLARRARLERARADPRAGASWPSSSISASRSASGGLRIVGHGRAPLATAGGAPQPGREPDQGDAGAAPRPEACQSSERLCRRGGDRGRASGPRAPSPSPRRSPTSAPRPARRPAGGRRPRSRVGAAREARARATRSRTTSRRRRRCISRRREQRRRRRRGRPATAARRPTRA